MCTTSTPIDFELAESQAIIRYFEEMTAQDRDVFYMQFSAGGDQSPLAKLVTRLEREEQEDRGKILESIVAVDKRRVVQDLYKTKFIPENHREKGYGYRPSFFSANLGYVAPIIQPQERFFDKTYLDLDSTAEKVYFEAVKGDSSLLGRQLFSATRNDSLALDVFKAYLPTEQPGAFTSVFIGMTEDAKKKISAEGYPTLQEAMNGLREQLTTFVLELHGNLIADIVSDKTLLQKHRSFCLGLKCFQALFECVIAFLPVPSSLPGGYPPDSSVTNFHERPAYYGKELLKAFSIEPSDISCQKVGGPKK